MLQLYFLPLWRHLFFLFIVALPFFSIAQDHDVFIEEDYLQVPDTIVFVSEEDVEFTEEYLMVHLYAIDKGEKFAVPAHFKIFNKENNKLHPGAPEDKHQYQAALVSNEEYLVEVNASGYLQHSEVINLKSLKGNKELHKIIPLEKSNFTTHLKAVNVISGKAVKNASITLINLSSNKTIHTLVNPETGECAAEFHQFDSYKVEINAKGYLPYTEEYYSNKKINKKDFKLIPEQKHVVLNVNVIDAQTENPVFSDLKLTTKDNELIPVKLVKESREASILSGTPYNLLVEANGYEPYKGNISVDAEQENNITIKLTAKIPDVFEKEIEKTEAEEEVFENLEVGKTVLLNNIFFDQSKFILKGASYKELNKLVSTLEKYPHLNIIIAGHTDNQGDKKLNQLLSLNRAKVIANYLIEKGVNTNRLEVVGFGSAHPVAPNDSEENRKKNRRVEFTIK